MAQGRTLLIGLQRTGLSLRVEFSLSLPSSVEKIVTSILTHAASWSQVRNCRQRRFSGEQTRRVLENIQISRARTLSTKRGNTGRTQAITVKGVNPSLDGAVGMVIQAVITSYAKATSSKVVAVAMDDNQCLPGENPRICNEQGLESEGWATAIVAALGEIIAAGLAGASIGVEIVAGAVDLIASFLEGVVAAEPVPYPNQSGGTNTPDAGVPMGTDPPTSQNDPDPPSNSDDSPFGDFGGGGGSSGYADEGKGGLLAELPVMQPDEG